MTFAAISSDARCFPHSAREHAVARRLAPSLQVLYNPTNSVAGRRYKKDEARGRLNRCGAVVGDQAGWRKGESLSSGL
jgi:hypothetical protein